MANITGNGTLQGTDAGDQITGGAGNDVLLGNGGADTLNGGDGFDFAAYWSSPFPISVQLYVGQASDDGFHGLDVLSNIEGIIGSAYNDTIIGGVLTDVLAGNDGADTLQGLGGNDALNGGAGDDEIRGGEGDDTVYADGDRADYTITAMAGGFILADNRAGAANQGTDTVTEVEFFSFSDGQISAAQLLAPVAHPTTGNDSIKRGPGANFVDALAGDDTVDGGGGNDTLAGSEGNDLLIGGDGTDTANFSGNRADYTVTAAQGGGLSIADKRGIDGTDIVRGMEFLAFADGAVSTAGLLPSVGVAADRTALAEGGAGATGFTFTVRLSAAAGTAQSVDWRVSGSGGAPTDASDFVGGGFPAGTLTFAAGETAKTITVNIAGDAGFEADETFAVALSNPSNGLLLGTASASATVLNDDAAPAPPSVPAIVGTAGNDSFGWVPGQHAYEGLGGRDTLDMTAFDFRRADVALQADGSLVVTHGGQMAVLRGVEEVRFADGRLVVDADDAAARVARLYEAALDRLPDQGGLNFWIGAIQHGQPLSGLAAGFLGSAEFASRFGDIADNGAFVDRLYQNVLGRAGEAGGRDFWVGSLNAGTSRADVLVAFSDGAENKAGTAALVGAGIWDRSEAAAQVARLYDTVLGRAPDAGGLAFWKNALEGGAATLGQMADAFAGSAEFQAKYGALGNRAFADALYVNTLDRPSDATGLDHWARVLDAGAATRAEVVLAFSEGAEHVRLTAHAIQSDNPAEFGILFA